jgi:hypothetical protein
MDISHKLNLFGLVLNLISSICLSKGLLTTKKQALMVGMARWGGNTEEENLKLPAVKDRLDQRKWAVAGLVLLFIGFLLQFIAEWFSL